MEFVSRINRAKILFFVFAIIFGGFTGQVNAATEKPVTEPSLLSVCINPAKTKTRAAQDDRCTDKNTGTIYESLPAKMASSSTRSNQSLPPLPANTADVAKAATVPAAASVVDTPGAIVTAPVANAAGGVAPVSLSAAMSVMPSSATSTTVPTKPVKPLNPVKTTVPVKKKTRTGLALLKQLCQW